MHSGITVQAPCDGLHEDNSTNKVLKSAKCIISEHSAINVRNRQGAGTDAHVFLEFPSSIKQTSIVNFNTRRKLLKAYHSSPQNYIIPYITKYYLPSIHAYLSFLPTEEKRHQCKIQLLVMVDEQKHARKRAYGYTYQ